MTGRFGRSYLYKGYVASNVAEYYGLWGAMTARVPYDALIIVGVGAARRKDSSTDIALDEGTWPAWVDAAVATGTSGGETVMRLKEGIERFLITDINNPVASSNAQSAIAVIWDTCGTSSNGALTIGGVIFNHIPGGSNALFRDGHVEFIQYPGAFPMLKDAGMMREMRLFGLY